MKVQKIQSAKPINFESKQRFVSPESRIVIRELIDKMREDAVYTSDGDRFVATIFKELSDAEGKVKLQDGKIYVGEKLPIDNKDLKGNTLFTIGKTELVIDNKTGEILDYYKPFFTTWKSVMKKLDKYVKFFRENYDNRELVKERKLRMSGFTEQGFEKFRKIQERHECLV